MSDTDSERRKEYMKNYYKRKNLLNLNYLINQVGKIELVALISKIGKQSSNF